MILYIIHKVPLFRRLYFRIIGKPFVRKKIRPILPLLSPDDSILDIGSGNGLVTYLLRGHHLNVTALDIHEGSYDASVKPVVYDGENIPFADQSFSVGIILTVLHHIEEPDIVLKEATRVCKRLIIMEDIYHNSIQKRMTFFLDKMANLFYSPCPHTNRTDEEWKKTFEAMGLRLVSVSYRYVIFVISQAIYEVETFQSVDERIDKKN